MDSLEEIERKLRAFVAALDESHPEAFDMVNLVGPAGFEFVGRHLEEWWQCKLWGKTPDGGDVCVYRPNGIQLSVSASYPTRTTTSIIWIERDSEGYRPKKQNLNTDRNHPQPDPK